MDFLSLTLQSLNNEQYDLAESYMKYYDHKIELELTCQLNFLQILDNHLEFFFRMYTRDEINEKWAFDDFGYLKIIHMDNISVGSFYGLESHILKFTCYNLPSNILRHNENGANYVVLTDFEGNNFMLYTPHPHLLNVLFSKI